MFSAPKEKRQVHELKAPQERSDEETEAMPAKSVHRSGNQRFLWLLFLQGPGVFAWFFLFIGVYSNPLPRLWFNSTVPFLFGVYMTILFVKVWSFKINLPLFLCVTIPCLIISFYSPVIYSIVSNTTSTPSSFSVPIPFWMIKINYFGIAPIVAGLTLIVSLFGDTQQSKN